MALVSIEQDAKYRRDGDRFVEVCASCGADRAGDKCACGATFERVKRGFFITKWTPTSVPIAMPKRCPHCEGDTDVLRSITLKVPTAMTGATSWKVSTMTIEVPSCRKMLPPFLAYMLLVTSGFFVVVFGLMSLFGAGPIGWVLLALSCAASWASWKAYGWIRFSNYDHRSIRLRARRPGYAALLADVNAGRVL